MTVTFFGHRDTTSDILPKLTATLRGLIENKGADTFYVGNNGNFDSLVCHALKNLSNEYPHIKYFVVLAYYPTSASADPEVNTIVFDGIENTHPRYAIVKRNEFMINKADTVVCYVKFSGGGSHRFCELAKKKSKTVINLAE